MKTIVITLQVPDGVEVRVNGGGQAVAQPPRPFAPQADSPYPGGVCPEHGEEWKLVPAGFSKTKINQDGSPKRYNAFWTCPVRDCQQKSQRVNVIEDVTYGGGYTEDSLLPF